MSRSRLLMLLHGAALLFTIGFGVVLILLATDVLSEGSASATLGDAGWMILLLLLGGATLAIALHFLLLVADDRLSGVLYSRVGEGGRVDVSPEAVREFIRGILASDSGIDRFRVFLRQREDGVAIRVRAVLTPEQRVTDVSERIQRELRRQVVDWAGVEVRDVTVFVRSIRRRDAAPQPIEDDAPDA